MRDASRAANAGKSRDIFNRFHNALDDYPRYARLILTNIIKYNQVACKSYKASSESLIFKDFSPLLFDLNKIDDNPLFYFLQAGLYRLHELHQPGGFISAGIQL